MKKMIINNQFIKFSLLLFLVFAKLTVHSQNTSDLGEKKWNKEDCIQPWSENLRYWQFKGEPVMLLGISQTDHLFLLDDLEKQLDEMKAVGANYVRNTMSQREGIELKPYRLLPNKKFDMDHWNEDYWRRFQDMLQWTFERDIIVQIEVWDRFDYSNKYWQHSPWRPGNNINYTYQQSGFAESYDEHPSHDKQPFFHTIPGMEMYLEKYDIIRHYQEKFVSKMLSYSLNYGHVLYCMNNETSTPAEWGQYWIKFIKDKAVEKGMKVCTTDMFDDAFDADKAIHTPIIFRDPEHYVFADISQVNSRIYNDVHWEKLKLLISLVNQHPRPSNHVKIYGGGFTIWGTGALEDQIERFWRDLLGGSAAVRFHRPGPTEGDAITYYRSGSIKAARILENQIKFWDVTPHMELLQNRESNEAYLAAKPGEKYVLYFTYGGSVDLDLSAAKGTFEITWISISEGITTRTTSAQVYKRTEKTIDGGSIVTVSAPYKGGWIAGIVKR